MAEYILAVAQKLLFTGGLGLHRPPTHVPSEVVVADKLAGGPCRDRRDPGVSRGVVGRDR